MSPPRWRRRCRLRRKIVMTNVYLADFNDWEEFEHGLTRFLDGRIPHRVTVEVSSLASGRHRDLDGVHVRQDCPTDTPSAP